MANKRNILPDNEKKGGGSRASKKRAKKRKKQQQIDQNGHVPEDEIEGPNKNAKTKSGGGKLTVKEDAAATKKKLQLPFDSDEESDDKKEVEKSKELKDTKKAPKKKKKKGKSDIIVTEEINEQPSTENETNAGNEEHLLYQYLSQLTPAEILFPGKYLSAMNNDEEEDGMDLTNLLGELATDKRANLLFSAILAPSGLSTESFYKHYWEKKPLLISKSENKAEPDQEGTLYGDQIELDGEDEQVYNKRFNGFLSKDSIRKLIEENPIQYGKDINVTNYCNNGSGEKHRITLDQLPGMSGDNEVADFINAESNDVWSNFASGCTLRLLCPQKHNDEVHCLLSNLEHEFGCMVGSNAYLTPGESENQGFAPHYDDIEAFILQLEGYKHWRVYPPMSKKDTLPRESSRDFTDEEMKDIEPAIDIELGPGDVLYMPRGWIHQANTCKNDNHSLHLTVSAMQSWSWVDLLEIIMPNALEAASTSSLSLRAGLPRKFLSFMGTMHDVEESRSDILNKLKEKNDEDDDEVDAEQVRRKIQQESFKAEAKKKILRVCKEALSMVTYGCDEIGIRMLSDRLPPALTEIEAALTSESRAESGGKIFPNTLVRLAKPGLARLVVEGGKVVVYHSLDNSRVYHETPLSPLEFEIDDAPALEMVLTTIEPHWICVQDLIHGDIEDKMDICQSLYDEGILAMFQNDRPDKSVQTG